MGKTPNLTPQFNIFFIISNDIINDTLKLFWQVEEVPKVVASAAEDTICEQIFQTTHTRDNTGRYIVTLPFRNSAPKFHNNRYAALKCFYNLERKLNTNDDLSAQYSDFMREYINEGHMIQMKNILPNENAYYIPHHAVVGTKLRVVFNGSFRTSNCVSLNDTLLIGPKLQQNLLRILLNFRLNRIAFTTDIRQMYRQIRVAEEHQDYQRILWRFSPDEDVATYRLLTVTYGVNSSPFLAIRTINQLAIDEGAEFPLAASVIQNDMYVDDIVSGSGTIIDALKLQSELTNIFKRGGFELRKWASNCPELLSHLPDSHVQNGTCLLDDDSTVKILGLLWNPSTDTLSYTVEPQISTKCTKRIILSEIARIYDVIGFLCPVIITSKYLIQYLWTLGLDWDVQPPPDVVSKWTQFKLELPLLSKISIPRLVPLLPDTSVSCQLHAFCDGSERAYAAAVYIRIVNKTSDTANVYLICAKSRVAPLKRLSVPRLELCAGVLLADLIDFVKTSYQNKLRFEKIFAWSDSTIALSWIKSSPHRWLTFVSNRVSYIQERVAPESWRHIPTSCNPADCASRGIMPSELVNHSLWWGGPPWLTHAEESWPQNEAHSAPNVHEEERKIILATTVEENFIDTLLSNHSSLAKVQRIIGYMSRFIYNTRSKVKRFGFLTNCELHSALMLTVKNVQTTYFTSEISAISKNQSVPKYLRKLNAFLDSQNILRVGGRLRNSQLKFEQKHPALLPKNGRFVQLLIEDTHKKYLHPGIQTTQYLLAQQFWILSSKRAIRTVNSRCLKCWKLKPTSPQPPMGDLPPLRISQLKSFSVVGVDCAGPFSILMSRHRGAKRLKSYLCLFVCFATKAIHLELASDLSTEAFLAALRRFIARRGRCSKIFSDCGSNFKGGHNQLLNIMATAVESERIDFNFNPSGAPHFGGLWESSIKSVKTHLFRVIGEQVLTYEELYTVFTQVEAVLNSRPLYAFSADPNDFSALTPGHFLTLEPLTCVPEPNLQSTPLSRLTRWNLLQRLHQDFWSRWKNEYLHTLSQRTKWVSDTTPIAVGTLVLLRNEITPPLQWRLGRVETVHPGRDGIIRVVTVRTPSGVVKRPVVKVCPLPLADQN